MASSMGHLRRMCTHSDFGRVVKEVTDMKTVIDAHLKRTPVVLYMKGTPAEPQCGFSWKAVQVLEACKAEYETHNVLADDRLRQGIKTYSEWPTIPQLYIKGEFVGGSDIMFEMAKSGDLKTSLADAGAVKEKAPAEE